MYYSSNTIIHLTLFVKKKHLPYLRQVFETQIHLQANFIFSPQLHFCFYRWNWPEPHHAPWTEDTHSYGFR